MEDAKIKPGKKDSVILAALPYILGWVVALIVYLVAKEDRYARYHALQSIMFDVCMMAVFMVEFVVYVLLFITIIGAFLMWGVIFLTVIAAFFVRLYMAYRAYKGGAFMLPGIGKMALEHI